MKFLLGFFSLEWMRVFDFLAPLAIRLLMVPVCWSAGVKHLGLFSSPDFKLMDLSSWWSYEAFQASVASFGDSIISGLGAETLLMLIGCIEITAAVLLLIGFAVRWVALAMMFVVVVLGLMSSGAAPLAEEAQKLVFEHGYVTTVHGQLEIYITYLVLLLSLFFMGAGRWFSVDWWLYRKFARGIERKEAGKRSGVADPFEIDATDEPGIRRS